MMLQNAETTVFKMKLEIAHIHANIKIINQILNLIRISYRLFFFRNLCKPISQLLCLI